jgi:septum formation protein
VARELTLASRSPQRRAILDQLGVPFRVEVPEVEELAEGDPGALAAENALRKARAVAERLSAGLVLAADTVVALDGLPYGKPTGEAEARAWLERLAGRDHAVWGGIVLIGPDGDEAVAQARTLVRFRALSAAEVDWYVASGEWRERAGGYAIQGRGAALVEAIEGDFWNVVGLPVAELLRLVPDLLVGGCGASGSGVAASPPQSDQRRATPRSASRSRSSSSAV